MRTERTNKIINNIVGTPTKEYHCPNCEKRDSLWPHYIGKGKKLYKCDNCNVVFTNAALNKAWGRTNKKSYTISVI